MACIVMADIVMARVAHVGEAAARNEVVAVDDGRDRDRAGEAELGDGDVSARRRREAVDRQLGRARLPNISEHADGERRGPASV